MLLGYIVLCLSVSMIAVMVSLPLLVKALIERDSGLLFASFVGIAGSGFAALSVFGLIGSLDSPNEANVNFFTAILMTILMILALAPTILLFLDYWNETPEQRQIKIDARNQKREKEAEEFVEGISALAEMAGHVQTFADDYSDKERERELKQKAHEVKLNAADIRMEQGHEADDILRPKPSVVSDHDDEPQPMIPDNIRTEHSMIVAKSGHGKTQLLQNLIMHDASNSGAVVVIDSQGEMIDKLVGVLPSARLVHITPDDDYPLSLNLFDKGTAPGLFEYMFSVQGANLTPKQATMYKYVSRLITQIPHGNIHTMFEIFETKDISKYREYVLKLPPVAQSFINKAFGGTKDAQREYGETINQIQRRMYTLLENDHFDLMFSAPEMKVNLTKEIEDEKIILIDTAQRLFEGYDDAASVLGRFWIAQLARAIFGQKSKFGNRLNVYIDEFQEYASNEKFLSQLFSQARKKNVSLNVAHQYIDQIPSDARAAIMTNTSAKMVGKVSAADQRLLKGEMRADDTFFDGLKKLEFVSSFGDDPNPTITAFKYGLVENMNAKPESEISAFRKAMRMMYHYDTSTPLETKEPEDEFNDFKDFD